MNQRWAVERIAEADSILTRPPRHSWIVRGPRTGRVVAQFALPLCLCPTGNAQLRRGMAAQEWLLQQRKTEVAQFMRLQCCPRETPLGGRPTVIAVRFSSATPDRCSDWAKWPVDVLCKRTAKLRNRLGIIEDDSPKHVDVHTWWEPASPRKGFVLLEVRTGHAARTN